MIAAQAAVLGLTLVISNGVIKNLGIDSLTVVSWSLIPKVRIL